MFVKLSWLTLVFCCIQLIDATVLRSSFEAAHPVDLNLIQVFDHLNINYDEIHYEVSQNETSQNIQETSSFKENQSIQEIPNIEEASNKTTSDKTIAFAGTYFIGWSSTDNGTRNGTEENDDGDEEEPEVNETVIFLQELCVLFMLFLIGLFCYWCICGGCANRTGRCECTVEDAENCEACLNGCELCLQCFVLLEAFK